MSQNSNLPSREISIIMLCQGDEYLFQRRTPESSNGAVNTMGCFGGGIEERRGFVRKMETPREAMFRELKEETGLVVYPEQYRFLGLVDVVSDRDGEPTDIRAHTYEYSGLPPGFEVRALVGELVRIRADKLTEDISIYSPATREVIKRFYKE